ncbi:MAG: TRAM domain-containing protein [[Clostridium] innocuum]
MLVDGASKKNPEVFSGYTETNKLVNFRRTTAQSGDIVSVKITACKTFSLDGNDIKVRNHFFSCQNMIK